MMDDTNHTGEKSEEATDSDLITYTQVACCAAKDYTSKPQRLSLRARLERERKEREERRQASFINTFRNLFGSSRH
jgi:hypothetical protein